VYRYGAALNAYDVTSKPITLEVKSFDDVPRVKDKYKDGTTVGLCTS
jgi:hypothetical protein